MDSFLVFLFSRPTAAAPAAKCITTAGRSWRAAETTGGSLSSSLNCSTSALAAFCDGTNFTAITPRVLISLRANQSPAFQHTRSTDMIIRPVKPCVHTTRHTLDHLNANGVFSRKSPAELRKFQQAEPQAVIGFSCTFQRIEFAVDLILMKINCTVPADNRMTDMTSD